MKKGKFFCVIIICVFFLSGCTGSTANTAGKIVLPQNNLMPIGGKWKIERGLNKDFTAMSNKVKSKWIDKYVQFSHDAVLLGNDLFKEPKYKIKRVNTDEYLLYRHKQPGEKYGIKDNKIYVITIAVKDLYSFDAILTGDGSLIIEFDDCILYLKKISNNVDSQLINNYNKDKGNNTVEVPAKESPSHSGLVLGLKYAGNDNNGELEYKYRTIWIGSEVKKLHPVMETSGIFFPRHDGFWRIETKRISAAGRSEDIFYAYSVANGSSEEIKNITLNPEKWEGQTGRILRSITYVGNDYIGIESTGEGRYYNSNKWNENRLQMQLVDNLPNLRNVKISDLVGENGIIAINNGRTEVLRLLNLRKINQRDTVQQDENYSLYRKAGHWIFKGRVNYEQDMMFKHSDFNINVIPPTEIVFYDDLCIPWTQIKDKVPEAIDAYTSPNRDIAIIVTRDRILIYEITNQTLGEVPIKKISLKNSETVIMAEWASGNYMNNWEKSFMKNAVKEVK